jgi:hypothetical protein
MGGGHNLNEQEGLAKLDVAVKRHASASPKKAQSIRKPELRFEERDQNQTIFVVSSSSRQKDTEFMV